MAQPPPSHSPWRFYNAQLRSPVYARCALPTKEAFPAATNAIPPSGYALGLEYVANQTAFQHIRQTPLSAPPPVPELSRAFRDFQMPATAPSPPHALSSSGSDEEGRSSAASCGKKRKKNSKASKPEKKPKTNGQKRAERDNVLLRTYKLRILPTHEQRAEFMRTFGILASIYNWANAMVRTGRAQPNHYELRKAFNAQQNGDAIDIGAPARVDVGTRAADDGTVTPVHTVFRSYAIKELADAHRHPKNIGHPENIGDRRMDLGDEKPTATFTIEKYTAGNSGLVRFDAARPAQRYRTDVVDGRFGPQPRRARGRGEHALMECDMYLGGNFRPLGAIRVQDKARTITALAAEGARLKENAKVLWDKRTGALYLIYMRALPKPVDPDPAFDHKRIVATDPGCTPFQAWYSPTTGCHGTVLAGMEAQLKARRHALDVQERRVQRRKAEDRRRDAPTSRSRRERLLLDAHIRAKARAHTTARMSRRLARERVRFTNWIAAAHYDAAHFLLRDHDVVVQPILKTARLIQDTPLPAYAQRLRDWAHYRFRQRLISASARYPGRHVLETTEPGTSKTCTHCGFWKADLGVADKTFRCPRCALCVDRQTAGARNNFLAAYGLAVGIGWDGIVVAG